MNILLIGILLISLIITSLIIVVFIKKKINDNEKEIEINYNKKMNNINNKFKSISDNDETSDSGAESSISELDVNRLIDAKISSLEESSSEMNTIDGDFRYLTGNELGFEIPDTSDKIIFNKEIHFNKNSILNSAVNIKILEGMIVPIDLGMYDISGHDRKKEHFDEAINEIEKSGFYLCDGTCHKVKNSDGTVYGRETPNMSSKIIQGINIDNIEL